MQLQVFTVSSSLSSPSITCTVHCLKQALRIGNRAKEIDGLLRSILVQLEKDKPKISPLDPTNDRYHCENFALTIFRRADKVDRAGRADVNTSKAFYASSIFIDVSLSQ